MTKQEIYQLMGSTDNLEGHEAALKQYLNEQLARYDRGVDTPQDIAYEIAGLMGTRAIWRRPSNDPYKTALRMAGYLELPDAHHEPGDSWDELKRLVAELP